MTVEPQKMNREQAEALEVAPGFDHDNLEGWVPPLTSDEEVRAAMDEAFDYHGDVTLTLKSGERLEGYVFNRCAGPTLGASFVQYFVVNDPAKHKAAYDQIAKIEFTGKDRASGRRWEDWVKQYNEKKSAGEENIGIEAEEID